MRILIAGGTGFLGRELTSALAAAGHHVTILTRRAATADQPPRLALAARSAPTRSEARNDDGPQYVSWSPDGSLGPWADACHGADIVVNLAGESIAAKRWSDARKAALTSSRILSTRSLVRFIERQSPRPQVFVSSSAIGIYGDRGDERLTEESAAGAGFLAELAVAWEEEARRADVPGTRVVLVRTGIVLDPREGALAKMLPPFRLGAGGPFGTGRQYMSWIHRDDWVALVLWAIATATAAGAINAVAPAPVTNREFADALGRVLRRPAALPAPAFALRLALGEMAGPLLLASQRVLPAKAEAAGFRFRFPALEPALRDLLGRR